MLVTFTLNVSEPGATVERISYGERIVLRPDPVPSDRGYEKGESQYFKAFLSLLRACFCTIVPQQTISFS